MNSPAIVLNVNGIEVIYNHVILVLKGVSLQVAQGQIVALLGGGLPHIKDAVGSGSYTYKSRERILAP